MKTGIVNNNRPYPHFKFPNEIYIRISKMSETDCQWHNVNLGSYETTIIKLTKYEND